MTPGDCIKAIRKDLTQEEFAEKIKVDLSSVQRLERTGALPKGDILKRIHRQFGVNINWLLTGEGDPYINKDTDQGEDAAQKSSAPFSAGTGSVHDEILLEAFKVVTGQLNALTGQLAAAQKEIENSGREREEMRQRIKTLEEQLPSLIWAGASKDASVT